MRLPLFKIEDPEQLRRVKQWPARRRLLITGRLPAGTAGPAEEQPAKTKRKKAHTNVNKHHKLAK